MFIEHNRGMLLNVTPEEYQNLVIRYIEEGIIPSNICIEDLVKQMDYLTPADKKNLDNGIQFIYSEEWVAQFAIKTREWFRFFIMGSQTNCLEQVKERANKFIPLLRDVSVPGAFAPLDYQSKV